LTKAELIGCVAEKAGLTKADAEKAVNAFTSSVTDALRRGDKVTLVGFGTFSAVKRAARKGRNPQTGKEIKIKATTAPKFKGWAGLKEALK
jgi:DNA-binding protein HU-beta